MKDFRVYIIDNSPMKISVSQPFDLDADTLRYEIKQNLMEIGWIAVKKQEETKTEIELTLAGEYSILPCNAPGLFRLKGIIPARLEG
jgi:hypothetical protein